MRSAWALGLLVFVGGCAARAPAPAAAPSPVHATSGAAALVATPPEPGLPLDRATHVATMYDHDTTDPESSLPTAGGIIRVHAPLDVTRAIAMDFDRYGDLNPDLETSRVVARQGDAADVYLRVPTVIPDVYIWALVRFEPVPVADGVAYRGRLLEGNLDDLRIYWHLAARGDETVGRMEVLADPRLPLPRKWVVRDTRLGIQWMLERFRDKAEARLFQHGHPMRVDDVDE